MTAQGIMVNNILPNCEEILIDCYHKYLNRVTFREPFHFKTLIVGVHDERFQFKVCRINSKSKNKHSYY